MTIPTPEIRKELYKKSIIKQNNVDLCKLSQVLDTGVQGDQKKVVHGYRG